MIFGDARVPFSRPPQAGQFVPRTFDARMYSDIEPYAQFMPPVTAQIPSLRLPLKMEPAANLAGFGGFGPKSPLAFAQRATRALPPGVRQQVAASKLRMGLNAAKLVARGRNPGA
jgi:hypothetical protein